MEIYIMRKITFKKTTTAKPSKAVYSLRKSKAETVKAVATIMAIPTTLARVMGTSKRWTFGLDWLGLRTVFTQNIIEPRMIDPYFPESPLLAWGVAPKGTFDR